MIARTRGFHLSVEADGFGGLQFNHQAVGRGMAAFENMAVQIAEIQHDFGHFAGHAFAGAQIKRHTRPARVVDFGFNRHIGFGVAAGGHLVLIQIACQGFAFFFAGNILAAHHIFIHISRSERLERFHHFEFFIAHGIGIEAGRRFHSRHTQHLHQVVLHHIAQGAGDVVKLAALFHAQLFGNGQLHAFHIFVVPQRLKHHVGKAQRQQVLQRFFAQIMVDAVDLVFLIECAHGGIDFLRRFQVGAQRFFQHHAHFAAVEADVGQVLANRREEFRRGGKIHHHIISVGALGHGFAQGFEGFGAGGIHH